MSDLDPRMQRAVAAREAGRYDEALALLQELFADLENPADASGPSVFFMLFMWKMLVEDDAAAHATLAALTVLRDEQVRRLLAGDELFGAELIGIPAYSHVRERFSIVVEMNDMLAQPQATHVLFVALERRDPVQAARRASAVLPALVAVGDFVRAKRYLGDPLDLLDPVNVNARTMPLFPPPGGAPRLAADLIALAGKVRLGVAVLEGLGRAEEAHALHAALLDGLESPELRAWAEREYAAPHTVTHALSAPPSVPPHLPSPGPGPCAGR